MSRPVHFTNCKGPVRNSLITPLREDSCQSLLAEIEDRHEFLVATDPAAIYYVTYADPATVDDGSHRPKNGVHVNELELILCTRVMT